MTYDSILQHHPNYQSNLDSLLFHQLYMQHLYQDSINSKDIIQYNDVTI